jgi:hypothetical protein
MRHQDGTGISEPHIRNDGYAIGKCEKSNNDRLLGACAVAGGGLKTNGGEESGP